MRLANGSWRDRAIDALDLKASQSASTYLMRAFLILCGMGAVLAALYFLNEGTGSLLMLLAACAGLIIACGNGMRPVLTIMTGLSIDVMAIAVFVAMPFVILACSPLFLIWNLVQAARAAGR